MGHIAYGLRADYADGYLGGLLAVTGATDFNVLAELEQGDGTIVVDDGYVALSTLLDEYPALKRVPVPAGAHVIGPFDRMTNEGLHTELALRGLPTGGGREARIARLTHPAGPPPADDPASGDLGVAGEPAVGGPGEPAAPDHDNDDPEA